MADKETMIARRLLKRRLCEVVQGNPSVRQIGLGGVTPEIDIIAYQTVNGSARVFSCKCHSEMAPLRQSRLRPARRPRPRLIFRNGSVRAPAGQN